MGQNPVKYHDFLVEIYPFKSTFPLKGKNQESGQGLSSHPKPAMPLKSICFRIDVVPIDAGRENFQWLVF